MRNYITKNFIIGVNESYVNVNTKVLWIFCGLLLVIFAIMFFFVNNNYKDIIMIVLIVISAIAFINKRICKKNNK